MVERPHPARLNKGARVGIDAFYYSTGGPRDGRARSSRGRGAGSAPGWRPSAVADGGAGKQSRWGLALLAPARQPVH
jgi:hypothetical protein